MASRKAIVASLTLLSHSFAGEVSDEKIEVYAAALDDVDDATLAAATATVIRTYTGAFIPPVAVLREAAGANGGAIDGAAVLGQIGDLAVYDPQGYRYPRVEAVRRQLGGLVADAYGAAGGPARVFSEHELTREIAARDFQRALESSRTQAVVVALLANPAARRLPWPTN